MGYQTPPLNPKDSVPSVSNASAALLSKWLLARGKVLSGNGNASLNLVGDSTQGLVGSGTGTQLTDGGQPKSLAASMVKLLNGAGGRSDFARADSVWGTHFTIAGSLALLTAYDTRLTAGAGWVQDAVGLAGASISAPASVTTTLTFQPSVAYNRVDVYYRRVSSGGGVTVTSASGGTDTWSTAGSAGVIKRTVSLTRGTGLLTFTPDGVGVGYYMIGFECWDSTVSQVLVRDMARSGSKASDWLVTTNPYSPGNVLPMVTADMTNLVFTLNDASVPITDTQFGTDLASLATIAAAGGDVSLTVSNESSSGWNVNATLTLQRSFAGQVRALGAARSYPVLDLPARWGDYVAANAKGLQGNDPHPNGSAYGDKGIGLMSFLWR